MHLLAFAFEINQDTIASIVALFTSLLVTWNLFKTQAVKKTAEATHVLTNSAMGAQLLTNAQGAEALAVMADRIATGGDKADIASAKALHVRANAAMALYTEHVKKQAVVDALAAV